MCMIYSKSYVYSLSQELYVYHIPRVMRIAYQKSYVYCILWHETNVLDNWQLTVLPQSGATGFDPRSVHYDDVTMGTIASQITSLASVYSIVYSSADQRKHQSSVSLAFVWGDRWIPRTNGQ